MPVHPAPDRGRADSPPGASGPQRSAGEQSSLHGPRARWARAIAVAVLLVYPACASVLLLTRNGWAVNRANVFVWTYTLGPGGLGLPISPERFADLANVVLFVPPFAALALLVPSWWWVAAGTAISTGIETAQLVRGGRDATVVDVLTNTCGAALGVALGLWIRRRLAAAEPSQAPEGRG